MSTPSFHLPENYTMLGPCSKSSSQRQFFIAANNKIPCLIWVEQSLPPALRTQPMVVQTYATGGGEAAVLRLDSMTIRQLIDTVGGIPATVAVHFIVGLVEETIFFHRQRSLMTSTRRYGPDVLDISSQGRISSRIDPSATREAAPLPDALLPIGEIPSTQTDVYYIGALLAWMISGRMGTPGDLSSIVPQHLAHGLRSILSRAMASDPAARPSAEELLKQLLGWVHGDVKAAPKKKATLGIGITGLVVAAVLGTMFFTHSFDMDFVAQKADSRQVVQATQTPSVREIGPVDTVVINQVDLTNPDKVDVYVSVLREGQPVKGVPKANVTGTQDGDPIYNFTWSLLDPSQAPVQVLLVMDTSGSMGPSVLGASDGALDSARTAAQDFLNNLPPGSSAGLIQFSDVVTVQQRLTPNIDTVSASVQNLQPGGQTAVYDGLGAALETLDGVSGRTMIVLLSDGGDTASSRFTAETVREKARTLNVPIYTIGLVSQEFDGDVLRSVADATGAAFLEAPSKDALSGLYGQVFKLIEGQYRLSYVPLHDYPSGQTVSLSIGVNNGVGEISSGTRIIVP